MTTNTKNTTSNASFEPKTYMDQAETVLRRMGVAIINFDVGQWLQRQKDAGVEVSQLEALWRAPENATLATDARNVSRVAYIIGELERKVESLKDSHDAASRKVQAEGVDKIVELAAESAETLVELTAKTKVFTSYLNAIKGRQASNQPASVIFNEMSAHVQRNLATSASNLRGRSTSWLENARVLSSLAALGDVGSIFIDVTDI